jgi:hypothetical protein
MQMMEVALSAPTFVTGEWVKMIGTLAIVQKYKLIMSISELALADPLHDRIISLWRKKIDLKDIPHVKTGKNTNEEQNNCYFAFRKDVLVSQQNIIVWQWQRNIVGFSRFSLEVFSYCSCREFGA